MYSWSIPQELNAFQIDLWVMESKAFVKSIVAIHILIHHSWHCCSSHPVRRKVVRCLVWAFESSLCFSLFLVESWIQSSVQNRRKQFVQRKQWTYRAVVTYIFHVTFLVQYFYFHFLPSFKSCLMMSLKICLTISFVSSSQALMFSTQLRRLHYPEIRKPNCPELDA